MNSLSFASLRLCEKLFFLYQIYATVYLYSKKFLN